MYHSVVIKIFIILVLFFFSNCKHCRFIYGKNYASVSHVTSPFITFDVTRMYKTFLYVV